MKVTLMNGECELLFSSPRGISVAPGEFNFHRTDVLFKFSLLCLSDMIHTATEKSG